MTVSKTIVIQVDLEMSIVAGKGALFIRFSTEWDNENVMGVRQKTRTGLSVTRYKGRDYDVSISKITLNPKTIGAKGHSPTNIT